MAFNFETFGTPTTPTTPVGAGTATQQKPAGFSFGAFGEEAKPVKRRGTIGKVAEFLAPTTVRTVEKLQEGEDIGLRDVAGSALEVGSFLIPAGAGVKGATLAARGLGLLAGKAVAKQVAKKAAVTLGQRVGQFAIGGAISGGMAEGGRAIGEGETAMEVIKRATGGAVAGGAVGAALPIAGRAISAATAPIRGAFAGRAARKATQEALLKTGEADARIATKTLTKTGKVVTDKIAREVVRQGVEESDVALLKTMGGKDLSKVQKMLDIRRKQLTNRRVVERATDVAGDTFLEKVAKPIQQLNRKAGEALETEAKKLAGRKINPQSAVESLAEEFDKAGIRFNKKGQPIFKGSDYEGLRSVQATLTNLWKRAVNIQKSQDALQIHRTKAFIDNMVEYGAEGTGLSGKSERIVKQFRHNLDAILDQQFKSYNKVNTVFAETISELNKVGAVLGKRFRIGDEFADTQAGLGLRRLMSNTQSRAQILQLIDGMQKVAKKYGIPIDEDVVSQAQFADVLEKVFGSEAPSSLMGQTEKAIGIGTDILRGNPLAAAARAGKAAIDITRGVNQENKIKALQTLISELAERKGAQNLKIAPTLIKSIIGRLQR